MKSYMATGSARWRGAVILLAAGVALAGCRRDGPAASAANKDVVTVGPENIYVVQRRTLHSGPVISGSLEPQRQATIRAQVGGPVLQTYAETGDRVKRNQLLARIDDTALRDAYLSAKASVSAAAQANDAAQHNLARSQKLEAAGAIAEADLETAQSAAAAANAQLADARARLALARKQLDQTEIRSPMTGVVSAKPVSAGDIVQPGTSLYTVVDPTSMRLRASVPAAALGDVHRGSVVQFAVRGYPDRAFQGRIRRIAPVADPTTRQVRVEVSIPNDAGRLVGGLFAQGRVETHTATGLAVPTSALTETGGGPPSVMKLAAGRAQQVPVQLGLRDDQAEMVEVSGKLAAGDTVLLGSAQGVEPGTPVQVQSAAERVAGSSD